ncbi:MAG: transglutaminase domain-containing protein [Candidatus Aenigmarchaeota archaeon]|nr:transglutaminase domain-containing protein [Candidatus Aenigmarchaeota archaeon]
MMKAVQYLFLCILLASTTFALEDLSSAKEIIVNSSLRSTLHVARTANSRVEQITAELYYFPLASKTLILQEQNINPEPRKIKEKLHFLWKNPSQDIIEIRVDSIIKSTADWPAITKKTQFPITTLPPEVMPYVMPSKMIDSQNPEIRAMADMLAQNETDLFELATKIAGWTKNNVKYNLSTLTAEVIQPASWVLRERYGVCDEMTGLFIALLRALGIPARYVSGISYTNSPLFDEKWGSHGWAEVFFPEIGWLPFDPTFGQFGWVDATHIKLRDSVDSSEPSVEFTWKASKANITADKLNVKTTLLKAIPAIEQRLSISVIPLKREVGFGSFNVVEATITNLMNYSIGADISLAQVTELDMIDASSRPLYLSPKQTKTVYWLAQVKVGLNESYSYEIPLLVFSERNESDKKFFKAQSNGLVYKKETFNNILKAEQAGITRVHTNKTVVLAQENKSVEHKNVSTTIIANTWSETLQEYLLKLLNGIKGVLTW